MKHVFRWCAALVALAAFAIPAQAAPEATKISSSSIASFHNANGTVNNDAFGGGTGIGNFFDGNTSSGVYIGPNGRAANGCYVLLTFSESHFITAINASCTTTHKYSLYYSTDGETWTAVEGGTEVSKAGTTELSPNVEAAYIKCVFDQVGGWTPTFSELEVWGYVPPKPVKISSSSIASFHNANGTVNNDAFGGGTGIGNFFDGNTSSGVYIGPNGRAANGCYLLLTFGQEYYITTINASCATTHKYSLYYSTDGETWTGVADGTEVSKAGTTELTPNVTASYIKCVFDQVGGWTQTFSELEVWGMDPADIACTHPTYTEWAPVAGTATCLENGIDERFCTVCNERFTRESTTLFPLGHDYVHAVTRAGTSSEFGAGSITCSRCAFCLDCSTPINVVTGTDTNGTKLCSMHVDGLHWFAELTVSSTGDEGWGQSPNKLIDKHWAEGEEWGAYWYGSQSGSGRDYVQFAFDETIDLAKIELSVPNRTHDVVFYAYDEANGTETEIQRLSVVADENNSNKLIRKTVYFFGEETSGYVLKALRVRSDNDGGNKFTLGEIHPYITARGAGMIRPVALVNDLDGYSSLAAAVAASTNGNDVITLQKTVVEDIVIPVGQTVTLDLNGCSVTNVSGNTVSVSGTFVVSDDHGGGEIVATGANKAVSVANGGSATLSGGTFRGGVEAAQGGSLVVSQGCLFDTPVPLAYCPDGFMCSADPNASGLYSIVARTIPSSATASDEEAAAAAAANVRVYDASVTAQFPASNDSGALKFVRVYTADGSFVTLRTSGASQTIDTTKLGADPSRIVAFYGDNVTATEGVDAPALVEEPEVVVENGAASVNLSVPVVSGLYYAIVGEDGAVLATINGGAAVSPSDDGVSKPATVTPAPAAWGAVRFKIKAQDDPFNQD